MKWKNKGKELEKYGVDVCSAFDAHNGIAIFGAGFIGSRIYRMIRPFKLFSYFIDNNIEKQRNGFENEEVLSVENAVKDSLFIIISGTIKNMEEMAEQLVRYGLQKKKDFITYDEFEGRWFRVLLFYKYEKLYTNLAQICVTERCTLKCKKCAHACHLVDIHSDDMSLEDAKKSADSFFKVFDFVGEFVLIGGEPFLYKRLNEIIAYIGEKYRSKIDLFTITTNGTIIPSIDTLNVCKQYGVTIRVSDYSDSLPKLKTQYDRFYKAIDNLEYIVWKTKKDSSWYDYGFFEINISNSDMIQKNFDLCGVSCREISGDKYYYCVMAHTVSKNSKANLGENDYFLIDTTTDKVELLEFECGYSKKGYLDMCSRCRGKAASNYLIPAAEQEE